MDTTTSSSATLHTADTISQLPVERLGEIEGVTHRVLWRDGSSMAGILTVEGGHRLGAHAHRQNHHHIWVLEGSARILTTVLGPGGYAHIPSGIVHDIDATETDGCTVYYLYLRQAG